MVFVDDFIENVEAAREAGINAIHFRSREQALMELAEYLDTDLITSIRHFMDQKNPVRFHLSGLETHPGIQELRLPSSIDFLEVNPPGKALDLGCGTGTNVITLAENGWYAEGMDFVPRAVRIARRKVEENRSE